MAKHIHIHLPARRATRDEGTAHDPKNGQFTSGAGGGATAHATKEKAGWKRDSDDPVAVHVPPPGAKVRNQMIEGHGVVKGVAGNVVTVAHTKTVGGKAYPQLDDFHASKLHPHEEAGSSRQAPASGAKKTNPLHDRPDNKPGEQPSDADMKKHPNYNEEDHQYLKGKGWTNSEIHQRWTAEHGNGQGPATGKVKAPDVTGVVGNPNFYKKK